MKAIKLNTTGKNKGHYSPGIISGGMLYISGQLSIDPDTRALPAGGIQEHMQQSLNNMERILVQAGLTKENVVQCRIYITKMEHWDPVNDVYRAFFGEHMPARIIVTVNELHFGCLTEIEAIAECTETTGGGNE